MAQPASIHVSSSPAAVSQLESLLRAADLGFWTFALQTRTLTVSPRFAAMFHLHEHAGPDEYIARIDPQDFPLVEKTLHALLAERSPYAIECRISTPDGLCWLALRGGSTQNENDQPHTIGGLALDITQRKKNEQLVRDSEERLRLATEAAELGLWVWDIVQDRLTWDNHRMCQILHAPDPALGHAKAWEFLYHSLHPDDHDACRTALATTLKDSGRFCFQGRFRSPGGPYRWIEMTGVLHRSQTGNPERLIGTADDITATKRREQRDSFLIQLDDTVRAMSDPYEITQTAAKLLGTHLEVNRCAYAEVDPDQDAFDVTGDYTSGVPSIVGRYRMVDFGAAAIDSMVAGLPFVSDDTETDPRIAEEYETYRVIAMRAIICVPLLKDGRFIAGIGVHQATPRRWREDEIELVKQVGGRCWESIERARVTREWKEREQRFRFLAESIPQMVWTARPDGGLDYVNSQGLSYFGLPEGELTGSGWLGCVHPEDQAQTVERWKQSLESGIPYETAFRLRRGADASWRWHLVRALPLVEGGIVAQWFGTCTDFEDQKANEFKLTIANRELEEFAYVASHDLQEPLRMINIYTELLLRRYLGTEPEAQNFAKIIRQGVTRMEGLIRDLLAFSRIVHTSEPPATNADLQSAYTEALSLLATRIAETKATITSDPLPVVKGDVPQLSHVFQNLLSNALKYCKKDTPPRVHISASRNADNWIIEVRDNGIGFDQKYAERIFGLFRRLHKEEYEGTGIGLAICQRIVERSGGHMWAESQSGLGSRFFFSLPA